MDFNWINSKNRRIVILISIVIISFSTYYSNFEIQVYNGHRKLFTIINLIGLYWISHLIYKSVREITPETFYKKKWHEIIRLIPILTFLFLMFIFAVIFDSIRDYHYDNFSNESNGRMINEKYYLFKVDGVIQYGQISYEKFKKQEGDIVLIKYSEKNPIINKPIE